MDFENLRHFLCNFLKGGNQYGGIQRREKQGLHRYEQPPFVKQGINSKSQRLVISNAIFAKTWDYILKGLSFINRECVDAIRTAIWELGKAGYTTHKQGRDDKGKMTAIEYTIYIVYAMFRVGYDIPYSLYTFYMPTI